MSGWREKFGKLSRSTSTEAGPLPAMPDPVAIPAALSRLATRAGLATADTEAHVQSTYGDELGRGTLSRLSEDLGLGVRIARGKASEQSPEAFPIVAIVHGGGAVILNRISKTEVKVEGASESATFPLARVDELLGGLFLLPGIGDATVAEASAESPTGFIAWARQLKNQNNLVAWMAGLLWKHHRPVVLQLFLAALISNMFLLALPLFIMSVYDRVIPHTAIETLQALAIGIGIVFVTDAALRFARLKFIDALGMTLSRRLQQYLYGRLLHLPLSGMPKSASSVQTIQSEMETLSLLVPEVGVGLVADGLFALTVLFLIASIGGPVVLAPAIGIVICVLIILNAARSARDEAAQSIALRGATSAQIGETVDAMVSVKACGGERALLDRYEKLTAMSAARTHAMRHKLRFATNSVAVLVQITIVATIILAVGRIGAGLMTIGSMAAITILVGRAVSPVGALADQVSRLRSVAAVVSAALDHLGEEEPKGNDRQKRSQSSVRGQFQLDHVSYTPPETTQSALADINLTINAGERVGIIGRNGSGKSTLLELLPGLLAPSDGTMRVDGHDARQYGAEALRRCVGFMSQDTVLFSRTLYDNICFGLDNVDDETFTRAAMLSGIDRLASRHPDGFSLHVGPHGEHLSAGERQAVGLARLFVRPRNALILDEPTSLMDQTAEAHIIRSLQNLPRTTTLVLSTHRLRLLDAVDRVIVLDQGKVIADGPKKDVLDSLSQPRAA